MNIEREAQWQADSLRREGSSLKRAAEYSILGGGIGALSSLARGTYDYSKDNVPKK